jgi:catechol 2,3-dioxygenase-like lactoylglutathione lyase family enzyme
VITNVRFAVLHVEDQERARDFFASTLGFAVRTDAPYGEDARWIEVGAPGAESYLVLAKADPEVRAVIRERLGPMSHVWFDCDDLDATFADLSAKGVPFPVEPQPAPWNPDGGRWAQFADPDGNLYGLTQRG